MSKQIEKKNVLILSMGGTIGMKSGVDEGPMAPSAVLKDLLQWVPELRVYAKIVVEVLDDIDSSLMKPDHWLKLAHRIEVAQTKESWSGIVVLHGTDTLAYSASALSFLLPALSLPVVLTGGQRPLASTRTDARNNLIGAVESALEGPVEVMIFFNNCAYRGNRATKIAISDFEGFGSPNYPPLGQAGISWNWREDRFWPATRRPGIWHGLPESLPVAPLVLPWLPGLDIQTMMPAFANQWAVVLEAFGTGNIPIQEDLSQGLMRYIDSGGLVIIKSQVNRGSVALDAYEPGAAMHKLGIRGSRDMTREAVVTKLMVLKGMGLSNDKISAHMTRSMVGELSE